jgi:hypothetical protein
MSAADRPTRRAPGAPASVGRAPAAADSSTIRRSIPDPRDAPIDDTVAALPPVPAERLHPDALRERFHHPPVWTPEFTDDRWRLGPDTPRPAAVLVPLVLRETEEEIGLARARVEVLGQLPTYTTGTGFIVTPVVGLVDAEHQLEPDANEVAEVFEVPLAYLLDPANHQRRLYRWSDGLERSFLAMPWRRPEDGREFFVWGVTAAMLRNLYRYIAA